MKCIICGKPIVLVPSAEERAKKCGGTAQHYRSLFTSHDDCFLAKRAKETRELMLRIST